MTERRLAIRSVVACDDVRHEVSGKLTLVGVYGPGIGVPMFPIRLQFKIVGIADFLKIGEAKIVARIISRDGSIENGWEATLDAPYIASGVPLPPLVFAAQVQKQCDLTFQHKAGGKWKDIQTWLVRSQQQVDRYEL